MENRPRVHKKKKKAQIKFGSGKLREWLVSLTAKVQPRKRTPGYQEKLKKDQGRERKRITHTARMS